MKIRVDELKCDECTVTLQRHFNNENYPNINPDDINTEEGVSSYNIVSLYKDDILFDKLYFCKSCISNYLKILDMEAEKDNKFRFEIEEIVPKNISDLKLLYKIKGY